MAEIDYEKLSRQQRLAIFLIVIGAEAAAELLRHFDDHEVEALCREMSNFALVPEDLQREAIEEFSGVVAQGATSIFGGATYAQRTLGLAKGDHKASTIMNHLGPTETSVDVIKDIGEMEARQIVNLIRHEQPQTIALILSYLDSGKTAEIFTLLAPEMREEVIERLGTIDSTPIEVVSKIARSLGKHFDTRTRPTLHHSGGVRAVATLLNQMKKDVSKALLGRLEERNAALGAEIRKKMFGFEDLTRLQSSDMQRVMREVDTSNLATAMKSASEPLRDKIYAALSKRAAEGLKEEIEMLGPVRLKDVEAAQEAIIAVVRRLEEEGQISLEDDSAQLVGS